MFKLFFLVTLGVCYINVYNWQGTVISIFCVQNVSRRAVLRWKTEQDSKQDIPDPDLVCQVRQPRHMFFFYSMAPKVKHSKKGHKDKAVKNK